MYMLKYPPRVNVIVGKQYQSNLYWLFRYHILAFFEKILKPTLPQPPDLNGLSYYCILMSQEDNQLRRNSGEVQNLKKNHLVQGDP